MPALRKLELCKKKADIPKPEVIARLAEASMILFEIAQRQALKAAQTTPKPTQTTPKPTQTTPKPTQTLAQATRKVARKKGKVLPEKGKVVRTLRRNVAP